jgi:hypothetical protein
MGQISETSDSVEGPAVMKKMWGAAMVMTMLVASNAVLAQSSLRTEDLIGRWGVAAYWNESDASRVTSQAKSYCNQPYVISRGRNNGAVMFEAFDGKPKEVTVRSGEIVALEASGRNTSKTVQSWNGSVLVLTYVEEEAKRRYGNMVFVRCSR